MERFGDGVTVSVADGIAMLTLDRPATRNAMTEAMWMALPGCLDQLAMDDAVRVILVTGGSGHFCVGADVSEFERVFVDATAARAYNDLVHAGQEAMTRVDKPTLAVVRGNAVGAGCGLAMACDLRFAATDARLAMPPARLGANYPFAGTRQLIHLVGPARAKDMLFSGRLVGAAEALAIGLVDRVIDADELDQAALDYANSVADLSASSNRATKQIVQAILDGTDTETPELKALFDNSFAGRDFREGYTAFLEKRKPVFR